MKFISLTNLEDKLSIYEIMDMYEDLEHAFENTFSNRMDASDAYVLTEFPFSKEDEAPDDYEVINWETGFYNGFPALQKCCKNKEVWILNGSHGILSRVV